MRKQRRWNELTVFQKKIYTILVRANGGPVTVGRIAASLNAKAAAVRDALATMPVEVSDTDMVTLIEDEDEDEE